MDYKIEVDYDSMDEERHPVSTGFNGFRNEVTWSVNLHVTTNEVLQEAAMYWAGESMDCLKAFVNTVFPLGTPDVPTLEEVDYDELCLAWGNL